MTKRFASVGLELASQPESVALVRGVLSGLAEWCELDPELVNDLKTVVSEACNNVVVHAYEGVPGPMAVTVQTRADGVTATVRDHGAGFHAVAARDDDMGVGLAVISALAARAEFSSPADGGTEVRMWLPYRSHPTAPPVAHLSATASLEHRAFERPRSDAATPATPALELSGDVCGTVSPVAVTTPVLGRLARAIAATARFSFDRFSDVYLIADTIGAHARRAATGDRISFSVESSPKRIELTVGPFGNGTSARLQRAEGSEPRDSALAVLADEVLIDQHERAETMRVVLLDRGGRQPDSRPF